MLETGRIQKLAPMVGAENIRVNDRAAAGFRIKISVVTSIL